MTTRFVPNPEGIKAIARSTTVQEDMTEAANQIANEAKSIAPFDQGDYIDGIQVASGVEDGKAIARVNAEDWKSLLIEMGTEDTPTFAPLRRGAESAGYRLGAV